MIHQEIGTLLISFSICTHDTAGNIIWHDLSGVDNDDFIAILVKRVTCLLKCYDQCIGVLNACTLVRMLESSNIPRHACLKLRDDPGNVRSRRIPIGEGTLITQSEGPTMHLQLFILLLVVLVESNQCCDLMTTIALYDIGLLDVVYFRNC